MKTLTVGNLKANFSEVLKSIQNGEEVIIEFGKKRDKIAVIIPYHKYTTRQRKVGILKGHASFEMKSDFSMSDEELLSL